MSTITWFKTSPSAGDPSCLCSWCEQPIGEEEAPLVRLFDLTKPEATEARFHRRCANAAGLVSLPIDDTFADFDYGDLP